MKNAFIVLNWLFQILELAATLLMAPLTLFLATALIAATALVNRQLRNPSRGMDGPRLWARRFRQGA